MDPPSSDGGIERDKLEEVKEGGPMHHCNLFDAEVTHRIAEAFLPGLASACVDNTFGVIFKFPGSVVVAMRKEMVDSLIPRSETFVAEAVVLEGEVETEAPEHPFDIISDFIDDFASSKRNFFSRVAGWLLSDLREDRIDEFVHEMEIKKFWMIERRETVAQTLLKNVDFKDAFHCNKKFNSADELAEHLPQCRFRTVHCPNEGCDDQFSAGNSEIHDAVCPFKMLPCEQHCSDILMRRDMDKHCITVCPMKQVNCPFSSVGCESSIPQSMLDQHKEEYVHAHVLSILQSIHKKADTEDLKHRVKQLEELSSPEQFAKAQNVRSLTTLIKNLEEKLGPIDVMPKTTSSEEIHSPKETFSDAPEDKEEHMESSNTKEVPTQPLPESKATDSPIENKESSPSPVPGKELSVSPAKSESSIVSSSKTEELTDSPTKNQTMQSPDKESPATKDRTRKSPAKEEHPVESSAVAKDVPDPPANIEEHKESSDKKSLAGNDLSSSREKKEELVDSPTKDRTRESPAKEGHPVKSSTVAKDVHDPPAKIEEHKESSDKKSLVGNDLSSSRAKKEELVDSPTKDITRESSAKEEHPIESSVVVKDPSDPLAKSEEHKESSNEKSYAANDLSSGQAKKEEHKDSATKERTTDKPAKEERPDKSSTVAKDLSDPPTKIEEHKESSGKPSLSGNDLTAKKEEHKDSATKERTTTDTPTKEEHPDESSTVAKDLSDPPTKMEEHKESSGKPSLSGNDLSEKKEKHKDLATKERTTDTPVKEEHPDESSTVAKDLSDPPTKIEEHKESSGKPSLSGNDFSAGQAEKEEVVDSSTKDKTRESSAKEEHPVEPSTVVKDLSDPPAKAEEHKEPSEDHRKDEGTYSSTKEHEQDESLVRKDESKKEEQKTSPVQTEEH